VLIGSFRPRVPHGGKWQDLENVFVWAPNQSAALIVGITLVAALSFGRSPDVRAMEFPAAFSIAEFASPPIKIAAPVKYSHSRRETVAFRLP